MNVSLLTELVKPVLLILPQMHRGKNALFQNVQITKKFLNSEYVKLVLNFTLQL